jgi:hypothetical protein
MVPSFPHGGMIPSPLVRHGQEECRAGRAGVNWGQETLGLSPMSSARGGVRRGWPSRVDRPHTPVIACADGRDRSPPPADLDDSRSPGGGGEADSPRGPLPRGEGEAAADPGDRHGRRQEQLSRAACPAARARAAKRRGPRLRPRSRGLRRNDHAWEQVTPPLLPKPLARNGSAPCSAVAIVDAGSAFAVVPARKKAALYRWSRGEPWRCRGLMAESGHGGSSWSAPGSKPAPTTASRSLFRLSGISQRAPFVTLHHLDYSVWSRRVTIISSRSSGWEPRSSGPHSQAPRPALRGLAPRASSRKLYRRGRFARLPNRRWLRERNLVGPGQ